MIRNILITIAAYIIVAESSVIFNQSKKNTDACGVPKSSMGLIVRGGSFPRGSFPWIVALMYNKSTPPQFFCSGTLISPAFVVTGKECVSN